MEEKARKCMTTHSKPHIAREEASPGEENAYDSDSFEEEEEKKETAPANPSEEDEVK